LEVTVFEGGGSLWPKISGRRGRHPPTTCAWLDRPVNALQFTAESFHIKKLCSRFSSRNHFCTKKSLCVFEAPWGGGFLIRGNTPYAVHLRLIGKFVVDFLLVILTCFARCFRFVTIYPFDRQAVSRTDYTARAKRVVCGGIL